MASTKQSKQAAAKRPDGNADALSVTAKPERFYRAGILFTRQATVVALADLSDEQVDALMNEPNLVVVETTLAAEAAKQEAKPATNPDTSA